MDEPNRIRHGLAFHSESGYKHQGAQSLIGHDIGFITVDVPFIFVPGVVEWAKFPQENVKLKGTSSQCVKITEKVSFNIASQASSVYILSVKKFIRKVANLARSNSVTRPVNFRMKIFS